MGLDVEGLRPFLRRLNQLPKTAQKEIREVAQMVAADEVNRIVSAGEASDAQSRAVAGFVRASRDRVPAISAGGSRRTGVTGGATAGQLFFGAEFGGRSRKRFEDITSTVRGRTGRARTVRVGSRFVGRKNTTAQFRPHLGRTGYWFWPTLRRDRDRMYSRWEQVVRAIEAEWMRGE